jgi:asparagine N-glycosylation enzyme membrane subunit Stt3
VDHIRGRDTQYLGIIGGIALFIALLLILPFANLADGFNLNRYSLFQPTILLLGIIYALTISVLSGYLSRAGLNKYYYPGSIAGVIILGFLVLKLAVPQFMGTFTSTLFTYLFPRVGGASTVAELSPLFANNGIDANFPGIISQLSPFYFAVLGLALLLYRYVRKEKAGDLLVVVWSLFILIITIDANRSSYYFAVNVAILCAYLSIEFVNLARLYKEMRIEHIILGILLPTLLLFIALSIFQTSNTLLLLLASIILPIGVMLLVYDLMKRPLTRNMEISLILLISTMLFVFPSMPSSIAEAKYASGPTPDWYTS